MRVRHLFVIRKRTSILLSTIVVTLLQSCSPTPMPTSAPEKPFLNPSEELRVKLLATHMKYFSGSTNEAEQSVREAVKLAPILSEPYDRDHELFLAHARLHLLAKLRYLDDVAQCEYVKAKYWYLVERESNMDATTLAKSVSEFTERECDRMVFEWDEGVQKNTGGDSPRYWSELVGNTSPEQWLATTYPLIKKIGEK